VVWRLILYQCVGAIQIVWHHLIIKTLCVEPGHRSAQTSTRVGNPFQKSFLVSNLISDVKKLIYKKNSCLVLECVNPSGGHLLVKCCFWGQLTETQPIKFWLILEWVTHSGSHVRCKISFQSSTNWNMKINLCG